MTRVLVCGGRTYANATVLNATLNGMHAYSPITCLIVGGAKGADELAAEWAREQGVTLHQYLANWDAEGKAAGPIRNRRMLKDGKPQVVVAFPGGKGTQDMCAQARAAQVPVIRVGVPGDAD